MDEKYEAVKRVAVKYIECLLVQFEWGGSWTNPMIPLEAIRLSEEDPELKKLVEEYVKIFYKTKFSDFEDCDDIIEIAQAALEFLDEYTKKPCYEMGLEVDDWIVIDKPACITNMFKNDDFLHPLHHYCFWDDLIRSNNAARKITEYFEKNILKNDTL